MWFYKARAKAKLRKTDNYERMCLGFFRTMVQPGSLSFTCTTLEEMFYVDPHGLVEDLKMLRGEKALFKKTIWVLASHVWHR